MLTGPGRWPVGGPSCLAQQGTHACTNSVIEPVKVHVILKCPSITAAQAGLFTNCATSIVARRQSWQHPWSRVHPSGTIRLSRQTSFDLLRKSRYIIVSA